MSEQIPAEVLQTVRACVAESLARPLDEITPEARLLDDLDADSLDFVDIVFMLEERLDIKMRESELAFVTKLDWSSPEVMKDGHLTRAVVDQVNDWIPGFPAHGNPDAATARDLFSAITIEVIARVAARRLSAKAAEGA